MSPSDASRSRIVPRTMSSPCPEPQHHSDGYDAGRNPPLYGAGRCPISHYHDLAANGICICPEQWFRSFVHIQRWITYFRPSVRSRCGHTMLAGRVVPSSCGYGEQVSKGPFPGCFSGQSPLSLRQNVHEKTAYAPPPLRIRGCPPAPRVPSGVLRADGSSPLGPPPGHHSRCE